MPEELNITTSIVSATNSTKEIPPIKYLFRLNEEGVYELQTNIDPLLECNVSALSIDEYQKIDLLDTSTRTTTVTTYPTDETVQPETHIYAKNNQTGEFEKFLAAYDTSPGAKNNLSGIDSWLYDMMEEREETVELVDVVKYLFFVYDGQDRGVVNPQDLELFEGNEFISLSSGTGWWWPIGSKETQNINGVEYAKGDPVSTTITDGVGPRWGKNHGGIDIANGIRGTNIIASKSGIVTKVVDEFGDGHAHINGVIKGAQQVCNGECKQGGGYGNHIKILHDDGTSSIYAHLGKGTIKVKTGELVEQGQLIGGMGTSGNSSGTHLHFEIIDANNSKLDPEEYVDPDPVKARATTSSSVRDWLWEIEGGSKYINGTTWTIFDPAGNDNTMNLAHGMVVASYNGGDSWYPDVIPGKITEGQTVTEEQAHKIWEIKIKGFNNAIDSACIKYGVTLQSYQKDALVSFIYRTGYGRGQHSALVSAYKEGGNAGLWNYMKTKYDQRKEYEVGTKKRVAEEYELFATGDYKYDPNGTAKYDQYCNNPNI